MSCFHDRFFGDHHLIYREELKRDGEKKVHCWWCHEPIWGSLHNCVECRYRPVHSYSSSKKHCLELREKLEDDGNKEVVCWGCDEPVLGPSYKCSVFKCSFLIHKLCTELSHKINHPLHPGHTLSLRGPAGTYRCDACGRSHDSTYLYDCYLCDFQLDIKCANRLLINPNDCHQHKFFPFWKQIQYNCEVCGEEITKLDYMVCNICKLLVHYSCSKIPRTIKIKLHNHFLNLIYSPHEIKKHDDMFCRICGGKVNIEYAAYYCQECSYILHTKCLRSFRDKYGESPAISESVPNKFVGHATHLIKALNQAEDKGPHLGEIQHFSHQQHKLIICNDEVKDDKLCEGCMQLISSVPFYSCAQCNLFLHTRCAELPTTIEQHPFHDFHTLTLLPRESNKSGVSLCDICSRNHRGFIYKCNHYWCYWGILDVQCGSIPETLKHEGHQHPFCLALDSKRRKCKACPCDEEYCSFVCTSCDFILGIRCANLPLVARHKYDAHLLKLTYAVEDSSGEYYCLICEKKRDHRHWFYYCEECNFPAHPDCVLLNYPCTTIGSTYTSEYHPHPLTVVDKTKGFLECDACKSILDDVVLECSQCKFSVHPPRPFGHDCLLILSERNRELE